MLRRPVPPWLPLYGLLLLGATLSPPFIQCIAGPLGLSWQPRDLLQNALLFVPLGIALRQLPWWVATAIALAISGSVEFAQRWMLRDPNVADIVGNLIGSQLGRLLPRPDLRAPTRRVALRVFGVAGVGALGLGLASAPRIHVSDFSNWESFPLALGSEPHGAAGVWPGVIGDVSIFDRALGAREIADWSQERDARGWSEGGPILSVRLSSPPEGRMDGPEGPERLPISPPPGGRRLDREGFFSDGTPWVLPDRAAEHVRERLMASGRMSVRARIRAIDLGLVGPGRIVTLSRTYGVRDFTLAQRGRNLQFRVRTPGNGGNGERVTARTRVGPVGLAGHEVWGVFDGDVARIFVDGECRGDALVAATRVRNRLGSMIVSLMVAATAFTGLAAAAAFGGASLRRRRLALVAAGGAAWLALLIAGLWSPFPDFDLPALLIGVASLAAAAPLLRGLAAPEPGR